MTIIKKPSVANDPRAVGITVGGTHSDFIHIRDQWNAAHEEFCVVEERLAWMTANNLYKGMTALIEHKDYLLREMMRLDEKRNILGGFGTNGHQK
jgi:hypothetical protein